MDAEVIIVLLFFLMFGIVPILYFSRQSKSIVESMQNIEPKIMDQEIDNSIKTNIKESLLTRSESARSNSSIMLIFTVVSLFIGSITFYNASAIAEYDKDYSDKAKDIKDGVNQKYFEAYASIRKINLDSLDRQRSSSNESVNINSQLFYEKARKNANNKYFKERHLEIDELMKSNPVSELESSRSFWYKFFTTFSIRIMISLFTFYLSQIFLKLYRYNLNISDFYINRYNAIFALSDKDLNLNFPDACSIFQHNIDFGEAPKNPIDTVVELLKVIKEFK